MSPWPGAPKSASSPPINAPSTRYPNTLNEHSSMGDVAEAMRTAFNGLTVHEQAFANLPNQIKTQASAAANTVLENVQSENVTNVVTAFNSQQGAIIYFPGLGSVNNQLGETFYETQQGDSGTKIILGDSSPVTLNLNPGVTPPWFVFIGNDSGSTVSVVTDSGATVAGITSFNQGGFGMIFYDGSTFWSEGVASDSGAGGGSGITQLTGPVTAGPGSGSKAATITPTGVSATSYTNANITVNAAGQITAASNGSSGGGGLFNQIMSPTPTMAGTGLTTSYGATGTFSASNVATGILFQETVSQSTIIEGLIQAYPASPFTLTILTSMPAPYSNVGGNGFVVANTPTGNAMWLGILIDSGLNIAGYKFSAPATIGANLYIFNPGLQGAPYIWQRYKDDGTNIYVSYSFDGVVWLQAYTVSRASSYLGSSGFNYLGFVIEPQGTVESCILMSWGITFP
jgi:hypothetical protein